MLILLSPQPRLVAGPGYEWAPSVEERAAIVQAIVESWGSNSPANPLAVLVGGQDERLRGLMARGQRLAMSPAGAAAALAWIGQTDVREVLPSVQCPTLVMRPENETYLDERHSRYVAEHIANARYVELPGEGTLLFGEAEAIADEIQHFLTGARRPVVSDRVLATVLFTDIVGSTERAAELGDGAWRSLLARHDSLVREEVQRHRGRFVKSLGDGALAVFDGPSRAISSAIAIRDGVHDLDLEIRAGLHTGECELLGDDDVGGLAVHIGARISSLAGPGEVLCQSTVRDLVVGSGQTWQPAASRTSRGSPDRGGSSLFPVSQGRNSALPFHAKRASRGRRRRRSSGRPILGRRGRRRSQLACCRGALGALAFWWARVEDESKEQTSGARGLPRDFAL